MSILASNTEAAPELLLNGRYQVVEVLSSVGWGKTYVAVETYRPDKPKCVIKQIQPISDDPDCLQAARRLFQREAKILETLGHHDLVPQLLDYIEVDRTFYIVQEFIAGQPLSVEVSPKQRWSESQVFDLLWEVLDILAFVHSEGVIHGNLQPDKLIRRASDDRLVLVGFNAINQVRTNLVAVLEQLSATIELGALGYMPMEQIRGNPRPCSDIYALGMIGIQALTGLNPMQLEEDLQTGEVVWQPQAMVSDELAAILTKMVRYHFKDRYQSAIDVLEALQSLVESDPSAQLGESIPETDSTSPDTATDSTAQQAESSPVSSSSTSSKRINGRTAGVATSIVLGFGASGYLLTQSANSFNLFDQGQGTLVQAQEKYQAGNLQEAVTLAQSISSNSATYKDAQVAIAQWQQDWQNAKVQSEAVQKAFDQRQWLNVLEEATRTPNITFWQQKIQPIVSQARVNLEEDAYQLLQQAYNRATDKDFVGALNILQQIPKQTKVYAKVQPKIAEYTEKRRIKADSLLQQAYRRATKQDFTGALALLKQIPNDTPAYAKAQPKITEYTQQQRFKASRLLQRAYNRASVRDFTRALEYLQQIPKDTPAYSKAQEKIVEYTEAQGLKAVTQKDKALTNRAAPTQPFQLDPFTRSQLSNDSSWSQQIPESVPSYPSNLDPGGRLQEINPPSSLMPRVYPASGEAGIDNGE